MVKLAKNGKMLVRLAIVISGYPATFPDRSLKIMKYSFWHKF